jgi:signal transduction histidine kinase
MLNPVPAEHKVDPPQAARDGLTRSFAESGTAEEFLTALATTVAELAAREPGHPLLAALVADLGRRTSDRIAAAAMHDIANVVQALDVNLEVMAEELADVFDPGQLDPARRVTLLTRFLESLGAARKAAATAGAIARRGLSIRVDRGGEADLTETLLTARAVARGLIPPHAEISVEQRLSGRVRARRTDILRVVLNLVRNAGDALAGEIGGMIMISAWQTDDDAFVQVADNGPGIAEADLGRIFDPFWTRKAAGTGVGLFLCRLLVEAWGGTLRADSRPGRGARFTFSIPRRIDP